MRFYAPLAIELPTEELEYVNTSDIQEKVSVLRERGLVVMDSYFDREVDEFLERYPVKREFYEPTSDMSYSHNYISVLRDDIVLRLVTNQTILRILAGYYARQPFLMRSPNLYVVYPDFDLEDEYLYPDVEAYRRSKSGAQFWHFDWTNQLTVHVHLNDITVDGTHMEYACGSQNRGLLSFNSDYDARFADAVVQREFEVVPLFGSRGTVIISNKAGLHRYHPVAYNFRALFDFSITPGNQICEPLPDCLKLVNSERNIPRADPSDLTRLQRQFIRYQCPELSSLE